MEENVFETVVCKCWLFCLGLIVLTICRNYDDVDSEIFPHDRQEHNYFAYNLWIEYLSIYVIMALLSFEWYVHKWIRELKTYINKNKQFINFITMT